MKEAKKSWIVRLRCVTIKDVVTTECTAAEARNNPYEHCAQESEVDQPDWEIISMEENR